MAGNKGRDFEAQFLESCPDNVYMYKIKDNPNFGKKNAIAVKNPFDFIMYSYPYLFLLELKSTKGSSFSFSEKIIKQHQIDSLLAVSKHRGAIAGFIFNFRPRQTKSKEFENAVYFVHIEDFVEFKNNTDKQSINEEDCASIGIRIWDRKKITRYEYFIEDFIREATKGR